MFIGVIVVLVQILEMSLDKFFFVFYNVLGIFFLLIIVNCVIFGGVVFVVQCEYNFIESIVYGVGSGMGWVLVIVLLVVVCEKLKYVDMFDGVCGFGFVFMIVGLMVFGFQLFIGIQL